jgi:four helix bundle protein
MRRAAVSIPSNIAEGQARRHTKEFIQFLHQALGSLAELETQTILAKELDYLKEKEAIIAQIEEIQKMIYGILRTLVTRH